MRRTHPPVNQVDYFAWSILKQIYPYLLQHKGRIVFAVLFLVAAKLASVALPFILKSIVDGLNLKQGNVETLIAVPIFLVIAYGLARFSMVLFGEIRDTIFGRVTERAIRRMSLRVFRHLHELDLEFHLDRRTGGLSRDIERGTSGVNFLMRFMVFNIIPTLLEIAMVVGILLFNYGIGFALITLISIVAYVLFSIVATDWRTNFVREANQADSSTNNQAIDSLINYETTKYFANEQFEYERYDGELEKWEFAKRKNRLSLFVLNSGQALIIGASITAMMMLAAMRVVEQTMTIGDFVLINAFMMQLFLPLNFLGFVYREIKGSLANVEQMFKLLEIKSKVTEVNDAPDLEVKQGLVEFDSVSFHYKAERKIIKDVSFRIQPGEKVAVVGASGSGKSTLVKLLFRFYDCHQGSVKIDGVNINDVSLNSLRRAIGIVPQDTVLFNDSIMENVRYGRPAASDEDVLKAIQMAHLDDLIADLPQGTKTMVGERGLKLSGGEKQRVAIARTILKNPRILVFDEATSSLDSHSEQALLTTIKTLSAKTTSFVIAHRLSTIVDADRIIVLDKGCIVESGTHQSLLGSDTQYAALWKAQQKQV
jgi:ATP-binding cassette, subfamily B, heavy metal transporter